MVEQRQTESWIEQARDGDELAVSKLLAVYHPTLRERVAGRMGTALKAKLEPEDILQNVYLDVFRRLDHFEYRGPSSFLNWVLTILDSKLRDAGRAIHRKARDIDREIPPQVVGGSESYLCLLDHLQADSCTPSRVVRGEEAVGAMMACLSRLPDLHRQVLQLRFLEGRPVGEVAVRLGKSDDTVVAVTRRALGLLRKSLDRMGEFTRGL